MQPSSWPGNAGSPGTRTQRRRSLTRGDQRRFQVPLGLEVLERRELLAADFSQFIDPHPAPGNGFGATVAPLSTGNVVITAPLDDAGGTDAGAVYLFNGATGELISTLTGSTAKDHIGDGGVTALANGNFVVLSLSWDYGTIEDSGAATFCDGNSGINGIVTPFNSLFQIGFAETSIVALPSGNYLVRMPKWGTNAAGAVTFGNGNTGVTGTVTAENTLYGSRPGDSVGTSITVLTNGNYVVSSRDWDNGAATDAGAVTFCDGDTGLGGPVNATNSLVGSRVNDHVGSGVVALTGGGYVVLSPSWDRRSGVKGDVITANVGAATFGNGTTGVQGTVTSINSLIGSSADDLVGLYGATALANGNYVVASPVWDNGGVADAGAATFGSGTTGIQGFVSSTNSLVGGRASDEVGSDVIALTNGDYVVCSPSWDRRTVTTRETIFADAGAATFGNGATGISGEVSAANSLIGLRENDRVSSKRVTPLANGNYVVRSPWWDNGVVTNAGATTFGSGTTGITGAVSSSNSLVGGSTDDKVGNDEVLALINGNYVVSSRLWDNGAIADAGAASFGNGATGISGVVSSSNSLVGGSPNDLVGSNGLFALTNGNYVVSSKVWDNGTVADAGAATFGSGNTGVSGEVSIANSLVGGQQGDGVGERVTTLANGNYLVHSVAWDNGATVNAGAVTFGDGNSGISGLVTAANSLVGSNPNDGIGNLLTVPLSNGNYVVISSGWDNGAAANAGAVTFGDGTAGVHGLINSLNSAVGAAADTTLLSPVADNQNATFFGRFPVTAGGIVRVGSQQDGFNNAPMTASFGEDENYIENADPILISDTAAISEIDYPALAGLTLTISLTAGGQDSDRLGIRTVGTNAGEINVQGSEVRIGDIVLGTFSGGEGTTPLVIALGSDATTPRVQVLLRNITFSNVSDNPPTAARTVQAIFSDDQGLTSAAATKQIGVTAVNDAPVLDNSLNQTLTGCKEDAAASPASDIAPLLITAVTDPDATELGIAVTSASSYSGTWQYLLAGSNTWTGMGTVSNSAALLLPDTAKVRFIPKPDFYGVVSLRYRAWDRSGPDAVGDRVNVVGNTGGSTPFSIAQESALLTVTPVNDKPVLGGISGSVGYVHDKPAITLAAFATVTDVDSANFNGGRLRVRITDGANTSNRLAIGTGFTVDASGNVLQGTTMIGKRVSNGFGTSELVITFNTNATKAIVQQLVRAITFKTIGGVGGVRKVVFTVSDGDGGLSAEATKLVNVT